MITKKITATLLTAVLAAGILASCGTSDSGNVSGGTEAQTSTATSSSTSDFDTSKMITVISREDGSGTRGAFTELFGIEEKDADGNKKDNTTQEAVIANKTDVMLQNVAGDEYAIGYVSLGSLNDNVKALDIDGVKASFENVKNGTYKISRPFNIATKDGLSETAQDFIDFILSKEGQEVVSDGYIPVDDAAPAYSGTKPSGKITVGGSSSVSPVMEKLKEAYTAQNPNASIEIQTSDSTSGMTGTTEGTYDIGMASRDLKDSEKAVLKDTAIALDGIAVIVNNANPLDAMTSQEVKDVFTGSVETWELK